MSPERKGRPLQQQQQPPPQQSPLQLPPQPQGSRLRPPITRRVSQEQQVEVAATLDAVANALRASAGVIGFRKEADGSPSAASTASTTSPLPSPPVPGSRTESPMQSSTSSRSDCESFAFWPSREAAIAEARAASSAALAAVGARKGFEASATRSKATAKLPKAVALVREDAPTRAASLAEARLAQKSKKKQAGRQEQSEAFSANVLHQLEETLALNDLGRRARSCGGCVA